MGDKPIVYITRDQGTDLSVPRYGRLKAPMFECDTMERPAIGDHPCIPAGTYEAQWTCHPEHGWVYQVMNVPGRTDILIHSANWWWQLLGCIALGRSIMPIQVTEAAAKEHNRTAGVMEMGLSSSDDAIKGFVRAMGQQPFRLIIS